MKHLGGFLQVVASAARCGGKARPAMVLGHILFLLCTGSGAAAVQASETFWVTNGPCVFRASLQFQTNVVSAPRSFRPPSTNLPPDIRRTLLYFLVAQQYQLDVDVRTNLVFDHFFLESLNHLVWTNVIAHTNGRSANVWSRRVRPEGWPERPTQASWDHYSLLWGMKGMTAISPGWEGEGSPGQVPITALTRRHGYTRGHYMGPAGFGTRFAGKRVWFLTTGDEIVERRIVREVVRTLDSDKLDYTIFLFNEDLPEGIVPLRVTRTDDIRMASPTRFVFCFGAPCTLFKTEQGGQMSADLPGFTVNTWKGGDSGSPDMLPMPGELIFTGGRNTSGASPKMQADMDELCRREGINPDRYQLQWADLSKFPYY